MGFGICGHRFRRSPFTNKIFYIYRIGLVFCVGCGHVWSLVLLLSVRIASLDDQT